MTRSNADSERRGLDLAVRRLEWMDAEGIWPHGQRYLWTDAFGVVLLVSLHRQLGDERYLVQAKQVVEDVDRVLGRDPGIRIGEAPDRDGQYFHYLGMWLFALQRLGRLEPSYGRRAVALAKAIHPHFVVPGAGVHWKMTEDLRRPYPGVGFGALDAFHGLVVYRLLDAVALRSEIADMEALVDRSYRNLVIDQDLGLGMMLWISHLDPTAEWAQVQRGRSTRMLDQMWIDPPGYFSRHPETPQVRFAFTNYGVAVGLQSQATWPDRVTRLREYFRTYRSGDSYDREAITHVMGGCADFPGDLIAGWRPTGGD